VGVRGLLGTVRLVALAAAVALAGCRSAAPPPTPAVTPDQLVAARGELVRPILGDMAALYRMRVPRAGSLRLTVLTLGGHVRMSVSEPLGSTLAIATSGPDGGSRLLDLREGCRLEGIDPATGLGLTGLPLDRAARLLAGRLPATSADRVSLSDDGALVVEGERWRVLVRVAPDPWRVVEVRDATRGGDGPAWSVWVTDHTLSLPMELRVERTDGDWAELELVGLDWNTLEELPPLPDLPPCR
jgi:hypothetical protein